MTSKDKKKVNTEKSDSSKRKNYAAPALEKGLDILELLSGEPDGLTVREISESLDRSIGELFRMLMVLEQRGYVMLPSSSDRYRITLRMFSIAHRHPPIKRLTDVAGPLMQELSYEVEQSCHFVVYYEGKGHVVVQQQSPSSRIFSVRLGAEAPLLNTCSGHVLLAFSKPEQRKRMIKRIPSHHPQRNKGIEGICKQIVANGFEALKSEQAQGVEDIGFPVFDHTGSMAGALVVPFLSYLDESHAVDFDDAVDVVGRFAVRLSEGLGFHLD